MASALSSTTTHTRVPLTNTQRASPCRCILSISRPCAVCLCWQPCSMASKPSGRCVLGCEGRGLNPGMHSDRKKRKEKQALARALGWEEAMLNIQWCNGCIIFQQDIHCIAFRECTSDYFFNNPLTACIFYLFLLHLFRSFGAKTIWCSACAASCSGCIRM